MTEIQKEKPNIKRPLLVSIVVPVLNEEDTIPIFLKTMQPIMVELRQELGEGSGTEILFIDDGSCDNTAQKVLTANGMGSEIRLLRLSRNFGKDAALSAGLEHAKGDAVIPMDVDLQDPPELLIEMVQAWKAGALVVNAVRTDRSSDSWLKRATSSAFYNLYNRLTSQPIPSNVGDFRLLDREVVAHISQMPEKIRFMKGIFSWVGYSPVEVHYIRPARTAGTTKWKGWSLWNFALDGITGSTTLPLRIWTYLGCLVAIGAIFYALLIVFRTAVFGIDVPGYASIMVTLLTVTGLNMIALGIIGEYIGRIAIEVRSRPLYLVKSVETAAPSFERSTLPTDGFMPNDSDVRVAR